MEIYHIIEDEGQVRCAWCGKLAKASQCYYVELTGGRKDIIVHITCIPADRLDKMYQSPVVKRRSPATVWRTRKTVLKLIIGGKK